jgi:hypothetical protein
VCKRCLGHVLLAALRDGYEAWVAFDRLVLRKSTSPLRPG